MNQTQAIAKLSKLLGEKFAYRIDKTAAVGEDREAARIVCEKAKQAADEAEAARNAKYLELLKDPLYVELAEKAQAAKKAYDKARGPLFRHRITVGRSNGLWFSVEADGDNWEEVVEKVTAKNSH